MRNHSNSYYELEADLDYKSVESAGANAGPRAQLGYTYKKACESWQTELKKKRRCPRSGLAV